MLQRQARFSLAFLLIAAAGVAQAAADWPQWRGPHRDGVSPDGGLAPEWPEGGPPLLWKTEGLGAGFSSLAVVGSRIYTTGDIGDGQYVLAVERDGGKPAWKTRIGPAWKDRYGGPRSTPTIDGGRLFVVSTEGDVVCLDTETGDLVWRRSLVQDFGGFMMKAQGSYEWKFSESPLVDGDRVVVTPGAAKAALVALDKGTGKQLWATEIPSLGERGVDGAGYASAVVSDGAGVRQYVQLLGRGAIGVEASTGRLLWSYNRIANDVANIPTPLIDGDLVFVSSGYGTGAALLRLEKTETGVAAREVYFLEGETMQNHHGGMVLHDGFVYTGSGHNKGFPLAVEMKTGRIAWGPARNDGKSSAAITLADGRIYFRYQDGRMILVEASPEGYREKGTFLIPSVEKESWSHPVVIGGRLYLREQDRLYCYDVTARSEDSSTR